METTPYLDEVIDNLPKADMARACRAELGLLRQAYVKALEDNGRLSDALNGLLDGLDSNNDERCGLTESEWETRIRNARAALLGDH